MRHSQRLPSRASCVACSILVPIALIMLLRQSMLTTHNTISHPASIDPAMLKSLCAEHHTSASKLVTHITSTTTSTNDDPTTSHTTTTPSGSTSVADPATTTSTTSTPNPTTPTPEAVPPPTNFQYTTYPAPTSTPITSEPYVSAYAAVCAIIKDQNQDIREWIYYHHWLGFEKIYIYDHNSSVPLFTEIQDWIRVGIVEYTMFAGHHNTTRPMKYRNSAQDYIYTECLKKARGRHQWLAVFDVDEYLVLYSQPGHRGINTFLKNYEPYGGLAINWRLFSSSGHMSRPSEPTIMAYTKCTPPDTIIKSIVNVPHTLQTGRDPHHFEYMKGYYHVNETFGQCAKGPKCLPVPKSQAHIGLHHYVLKSRDQYEAKMKRGGGAGSLKGWNFFEVVERWANETCPWGVEIAKECCLGVSGAAAQSAEVHVDLPAGSEGAE